MSFYVRPLTTLYTFCCAFFREYLRGVLFLMFAGSSELMEANAEGSASKWNLLIMLMLWINLWRTGNEVGSFWNIFMGKLNLLGSTKTFLLIMKELNRKKSGQYFKFKGKFSQINNRETFPKQSTPTDPEIY